jgi:hypothetical protein
MDIDKLLKMVVDYLSDYVSAFAAILQNPTLHFRPVPGAVPAAGNAEIYPEPGPSARSVRLDPRLFSFALLSIFAGSTINALIPGAPAPPDFPTTAVIVLATWFFYSFVIFALARLLGGPGTFWETISISLQVFSVLYVISSFGALLWAGLAQAPQVRAALLSLRLRPLGLLISQPVLVYFILQFLLLAVYLPLSMKHVHRLNRVEQLLVGLFSLVIILIGYTLYPIIGLVLQPA